MNTNLFYFHTLNSIGGIETFFWNMAQKYGKDFDITILYRNGDPEQVKRLAELVRVKKYRDGEIVKCKRAFVAFNTDILDNIEAEEYFQMLHGDYRSLGVLPQKHPKLQEYVACSKIVRDAYADITGKVAEVSYNPFVYHKPKKVLRLVSATRLTKDKGLGRMNILADALEEAGIPYVWDIYTDTERPVKNKNMVIRPPRLDIIDYIADADYYVQLSDAEGYCYSVVEALSVGTPVIVTEFSVTKEIGVVDGVNGFILPFGMENIPVKAIYKGLKKFKYTAPEDRWNELLLPVPPDYEEQMNQTVKVRCKKIFIDLERGKTTEANEEWECTRRRAETLQDLGVVDIIEE